MFNSKDIDWNVKTSVGDVVCIASRSVLKNRILRKENGSREPYMIILVRYRRVVSYILTLATLNTIFHRGQREGWST